MRERLTDKLLKGLESPATGQIDVWDKITPGFGIRVSMGGRKSFMVGTRINGKFRRITLKPAYDALTLAEARKKAQQILADAQAGMAQSRGSDARRRAHSELSPLLSCRTMQRTIARAMRCSARSTSILSTGTTAQSRRSSAQILKS